MKPGTLNWIRYATRSLCVFPPVVLGAFYLTWVVGRLALGYWPRPSLDDPNYIPGMLMSWIYNSTALFFMVGMPLFFLAVMAGGMCLFLKKPEGWKARLTELGCASILFAGLLFFLRWDPQSVVSWYFD
jgi:hypothetical protein